MVFMVNSDRKKIYLTGRVSYVGGKQKMHLRLKVNKIQKKCHMNCVGSVRWRRKNIYNDGRFQPRRERSQRSQQQTVSSHAVLVTIHDGGDRQAPGGRQPGISHLFRHTTKARAPRGECTTE